MENPSPSDSGKLHVLLVDDSISTLTMTEGWLQAAGHRVSTRTAAVGTAADVIRLQPDVVMLEVAMAGIRGDDLARLLKRHPATQGVAVILYSAIPRQELRTMIMTTGALGVIEKTTNQTMFSYAFNGLTTRLRSSARIQDSGSSQPPATSGTFPTEKVASLQAGIRRIASRR